MDEIFDRLGEACGPNTCQTNEIEIDGQTHDETATQNIQLTMGPGGEYSEGMRDRLFQAWEAAVFAVAQCEDLTFTRPCPNPQVFCGNDPVTVNQCEVNFPVPF